MAVDLVYFKEFNSKKWQFFFFPKWSKRFCYVQGKFFFLVLHRFLLLKKLKEIFYSVATFKNVKKMLILGEQ